MNTLYVHYYENMPNLFSNSSEVKKMVLNSTAKK